MRIRSLRYGKIIAVAAFWVLVGGIVASRIVYFDGIVAAVSARANAPAK